MSSGDNLPWFKMYPQEFMGDENVQLMGPTELGVYFAMLLHQWKAGAVPDDPKMVARICRGSEAEVREAWTLVRPCFDPCDDRDGYICQPRLEAERKAALDRRRAARKAAKARSASADRDESGRYASDEPAKEPADGPADAGADGGAGDPASSPAMRASDASDVQKVRGTDVQKDQKQHSEDVKSSGASPDVENSRETGNRWGETVTACREHLWLDDDPPRSRSVGEELSAAKQICERWNLAPSEIPEVVEGFAQRREAGQWEGWVEPGEPATLLALNRRLSDEQGIPVVVRCLHEVRKNGTPSERDGGMSRVSA